MFRVPTFSVVTLAIAALIGCSMVQGLARLPSWPCSAVVVGLALVALLLFRSHALKHTAALTLFAAWTALVGARAVTDRLPVKEAGNDITVIGRVVDLPRRAGADSAFVFVPESVVAPDPGVAVPPSLAGRWRVTWYRTEHTPLPCERWQLRLRLRRPRGTLNPGASDAERTALQRGVTATGYVRKAPGNARLSTGACIDGWRHSLAMAIDARLGEHDARLIRALAVGDTRGLDASDWDLARTTGVSHLMAISGFHVGIAAGGGVLLLRLIYLRFPRLALRLPRPVAQAISGWVIAALYALMAGMSLPTVRALLMITLVVLAACQRRRIGRAPLLALALLPVLVVAPLSVLSAGFWLSFAGVGFLMLCVAPRGAGWRGWVGELLRAQAAMSLILLPLSLWWFGSASVAGFVANLVAAPLVSFIVVPLCLAGCLCLAWPSLAGSLLGAAATLLAWLWRWLDLLAQWPGARFGVAESGLVPVLLATAGAAWLFVPRGVPLRALGAVLCLPLLVPRHDEPASGAFRVWVLDVGQGLAVLVRTRRHTLVYDTGPAYTGGRDAGAGVVLPAITALGIAPVHTLVVSHGDSDHAGGAGSVVSRYPGAARFSGEPARLTFDARRCTAEDAWAWDGVRFRFIDVPRERSGKTTANDRSCVLAVEGAGGRMLLTGDIGERAERRIHRDDLISDLPTVTTVAHHGSKHSSSAYWVDTAEPMLAIASAGWRNRFGHPHPSVVHRFERAGTHFHNTANGGAIRVEVFADGEPAVVRRWRDAPRRYWRE